MRFWITAPRLENHAHMRKQGAHRAVLGGSVDVVEGEPIGEHVENVKDVVGGHLEDPL